MPSFNAVLGQLWGGLQLEIGNLKRLDLSKYLQSVSQTKRVIHFELLKDVETAVEADFPARVGCDVTRVDGVGPVEFP